MNVEVGMLRDMATQSDEFVEWLLVQTARTGMTRRQLAAATGMSDGAVKNWFHGSIPQRETVSLIAAALDADLLEAQRAAGHLRRATDGPVRPMSHDDVPPLTPDEILLLRSFLQGWTLDQEQQFRRMAALLGDMSPAAWRRLRSLGEALEREF